MGRKKISLDKKELRKLYLEKNLSPYKIARILGCSFTTITNRLKEYKIPLKTPAYARTKYPKKDFSGDLEEKSYILGFRLGDLNCYRISERSETIVARCHTTEKVQVTLIDGLFSSYGKVTISKNRGHYHINCLLNNSFHFLLTKKFSPKNLHQLSFVARYYDAEGNSQLNQGRARIKIDSYDYEILAWISEFLTKIGIENKFWMIGTKGSLRNDDTYFNKNLWRLTINKANSIMKFINEIGPFLKHQKQIQRMKKCFINIQDRIEKGSVKLHAIR